MLITCAGTCMYLVVAGYLKYTHTRFINVLNFIMVMFIHVSLHASRCVPRVHTNEIINEHTQRRLPYEIGRDVHKIIEGCKLQILVVMHKHLSSFAI